MLRVEGLKANDQAQTVQLQDNQGELAESEDRDGLDLENSVKLPGFGLPVNYTPDKYFPSAALDWSGTILTVRELNMMGIMERITNKKDWDKKVFDDTIVQKWRQEALGTEGMDVSEKMLDWCVAELRDKARYFQSDGIIPTLDLDAAVVKSDTVISSDLKEALRAAAAPLEDVPDRFRDWHPGSDDKVLNLVHPSLFPLIYGRSRILSSGRVELADCVNCIGKGQIATTPDDTDVQVDDPRHMYRSWHRGHDPKFWSKTFQWLPCDVELTGDDVKITSYINNLHPKVHPKLYSVIENFISKAIPLWDFTLSSTRARRKARILHDQTDYDYPQGVNPPEALGNDWDAREDWKKTNRVLIRPEPRDFEPYQRLVDDEVHLRKQYGGQGLQVIVKLANIELTPEKPTYEGGSWHVEGQLNEQICATVLYYYNSENVEDNSLAFRHRTIDEDFEGEKQYEQNDYEGTEELYGVQQDAPKVQGIGSVITREGRLLAFPNVFQHRVSPFKLEDPSKPGHRKLLALFLIDPHCRIISTANVPPQQKDWWSPEIRDSERLATLPNEIVDHIMEDVDFPISLEEAKELRLDLIEERKAYVEDVNEEMQNETFSFCEH